MSQTVRIESVVKEYGNFRAIDNVSLEIKPGEFFTLLGPSGCGKTTLLRMIAGFNTIESGKIYFNDEEINDVPAHKRNVGMVFQNYAIFPHMSVKDNVAYGLKARKIKGAELIKRTEQALKLMQMYEYKDRQPSQLSGGQQQRVALARAIVIHPSVLLMDEPLSNLDAKLRVQMRSSIKKLQKSLNITTIYVTHDQEEALAISDRIAVMNNGRVEQIGEPKEIYMRPANTFVANFIGTSNFLQGEADNGVVTILGKVKIPVKLKEGYKGKVIVSVRPENAALCPVQEGMLKGKVVFATFLGDYINYEIELEDGTSMEINEYTSNVDQHWEAGDLAGIDLNTKRITVFDHETEKSIMVY
ncbi:MAG TPA: ABC transporter ATP-binding protein [Clostridiaceae bacterium]|nr:ABC transporter ATP-binding protein [Clostridiaceae bacterium]